MVVFPALALPMIRIWKLSPHFVQNSMSSSAEGSAVDVSNSEGMVKLDRGKQSGCSKPMSLHCIDAQRRRDLEEIEAIFSIVIAFNSAMG